MNNHSIRQGIKVGEWISEEGLDVKKAFLWPYQPQIAKNIKISGEAESVIAVDPEAHRGGRRHQEGIDIGFIESHKYTGQDFDFEYGWAIAEDTRNALEQQIEPEENLQLHEYSDVKVRDLTLNRAFSRITSTSDRLLREEGATVVYSMASVKRYELPDLAEDSLENQEEYARRISEHLERHGFDTDLLYDSDISKDVYVSGRR